MNITIFMLSILKLLQADDAQLIKLYKSNREALDKVTPEFGQNPPVLKWAEFYFRLELDDLLLKCIPVEYQITTIADKLRLLREGWEKQVETMSELEREKLVNEISAQALKLEDFQSVISRFSIDVKAIMAAHEAHYQKVPGSKDS